MVEEGVAALALSVRCPFGVVLYQALDSYSKDSYSSPLD